MSALIENVNGVDQFIGRTDAWHRLGDVVGDDFDFELVKLSRPEIASPVFKSPLFTVGEDGYPDHQSYTKCAVVREYDSKIVGVVGTEYGCVNPEEAYEWANTISQFGDIPIVSAGNLRDGSQFFFTLRMGTESPAGIDYTPYITVVSSHDGSQAMQAIFSPTVVVCANTLAMAQSDAVHKISLRHTSRIQDRMAIALDTLRLGATQVDDTNNLIHLLANTPISFHEAMAHILPEIEAEGAAKTRRSNMITEMFHLRDQYTPEEYLSTGWGLIQAVNSWENWAKPIRSTTSTDDARAVRQFDAAVKGTGQDITKRAVQFVLANA